MIIARRAIDPPPPPGLSPERLRVRRIGERRPAVRRAYAVAPAIAAAMLILTLTAGGRYGIGVRDPDGIIGGRLFLLLGLIFAFWALDVVPRAIRDVARERWSWRRVGVVLGSILAFYITYLCYRNIKSYLPLARPELFDTQLLAFERTLFGQDPATFLHSVLGTGVAAHVLSTVYLLFLTFVPVSLAYALVWSTDTATGLWWVTALSLNWVLGAFSYFLIPSLGPAFASPELFSALPDTGASALQAMLMEERQAFLRSPVYSGELQSIAAFASLHVAIVFTGALMAHLLRAPRALRVGMWTFLALTVLATIYFGWHYVVDDIAGAVIAVVAVYLGARLTGWRIERARSEPALQLGGV